MYEQKRAEFIAVISQYIKLADAQAYFGRLALNYADPADLADWMVEDDPELAAGIGEALEKLAARNGSGE